MIQFNKKPLPVKGYFTLLKQKANLSVGAVHVRQSQNTDHANVLRSFIVTNVDQI